MWFTALFYILLYCEVSSVNRFCLLCCNSTTLSNSSHESMLVDLTSFTIERRSDFLRSFFFFLYSSWPSRNVFDKRKHTKLLLQAVWCLGNPQFGYARVLFLMCWWTLRDEWSRAEKSFTHDNWTSPKIGILFSYFFFLVISRITSAHHMQTSFARNCLNFCSSKNRKEKESTNQSLQLHTRLRFNVNMITSWTITWRPCGSKNHLSSTRCRYQRTVLELKETYLSVNVNRICGGSINLQFGFSIFCNLSDERHWKSQVVILVARHFHVKEADRFFRCCANRSSLLKVFTVWLKIFFVTWWVQILKSIKVESFVSKISMKSRANELWLVTLEM